MPGVVGVFTAADLRDLGPLPCTVPVASVAPMIVPPRFALADGSRAACRRSGGVRRCRDPRRRARCGGGGHVDYRVLPSVVDAPAALCATHRQLWDQAPDNLSYRFQKGDAAAVRAAMQAAAHVVELELVNNRIVISALETRGAIGQHDADGFHLTFSGAGVHALRSQLADSVFRVPQAQMRVSCPDVGGGFGVKNALYPEWVMLLWAARRLGQTGEMDRRSRRGFRHDRAGARQRYARAAGAGRRWPVPCAGRGHCCQSRCVSFVRRSGQFHQCAGQRHGQRLCHSGDLHGCAGRVHQHRADRCLSRRRQA